MPSLPEKSILKLVINIFELSQSKASFFEFSKIRFLITIFESYKLIASSVVEFCIFNHQLLTLNYLKIKF